jgi:hypothetical protein
MPLYGAAPQVTGVGDFADAGRDALPLDVVPNKLVHSLSRRVVHISPSPLLQDSNLEYSMNKNLCSVPKMV